ncbi:hypothetical protein [Clostridium sp. YIM B02506]|uniref:hypothetical protein n=1 Tax=Clostridium sp. YIM B02506 TaxID=2910680 RepID=UPI001EEF38E8|nr:hypothetical protein [Clostridium sp. YIM B02506]
MATLNMGNSNVIGISYNEMNKMKSNLKRSQQMLETSQRNVGTARVQIQVDRGRLRVTEDSLSSIYSEASKRKTKIDKMCSNIDYTIRRFKEVDSRCAKSIKAIGNSYSTKTSLFDKIKNAMISLGNYIFGRVTSLLKEGQDAFDNLGSKNSTEKDSYLEMIDSPYSMSDNPTLGQLIELNPNAPMYENAANEGQKYFLVWYYGSAAYERLDAATLSHNSYLVYKLTNLYKEGVDLSKLTITDIDRMCFDNASFWTKADQVVVGAYGAYTGYKYIKGKQSSKSYTGGRTQSELESLEYDPAKKAVTEGSKKEAVIGLDLEQKGKLGKIERSSDPKAEFIDTVTGKKIDVKSFESYPMGADGTPITSPRKGAFKVENAMKNIMKEFQKNGNDIVIIDKSNLTVDHIKELEGAIKESGLENKIIWWPE